MTVAAYVAKAQRRLAGCSPRSWHRAAMVDAAEVRAAFAGGDWRREQALHTVTDVAVFTVRGPRGEAGVLKVSATASGMAGLRRERDVLSELRSDPQMGDWRSLLPVVLDAGNAGDGAFLLTSRLPGLNGREFPLASASGLTSAAIDVIAPLHRRNQRVRRVDEELLSRWVNEPTDQIRMTLRSEWGIDRLAEALRADLAGRTLTLGWTHGDYHRGNLLASAAGQVTGIVDWGEAGDQDLPILDVAFWLLATPGPGQPREFGRRVAARLASGQFWTPAERHLLSGMTDADMAFGPTLLLLVWLRHVASNLAKSERYAGSPLWLRWNVLSVLRQVSRG